MTAFWIAITGLGLLASIINLTIAVVRRAKPSVAIIRGIAGLVSLALAVGIVVGKQVLRLHPPFELTQQVVFMAAGVVIFALLVLPSYVDPSRKDPRNVSIQQRAVRPAKATIRLQRLEGDEWVN